MREKRNKIFTRSRKLFRKIGRNKVSLAFGVLFIPLVFIIRFIKPIVHIRFGGLNSKQFGHFVGETFEAMRILSTNKKNQIDIYHFNSLPVINEQWARMIQRNIPIHNIIGKSFYRWNQIIPGGKAHQIFLNINPPTFLKYFQAEKFISMEFINSEEVIAKKFMKQQGWTEGEPFICLQVRDEAFNAKSDSPEQTKELETLWGFTSYRDSKIDSYISAVQWLLDQNIWIFRMGSVMKRRMPLRHKRFIDYAFSDERSDLLDIWLFANAKCIISTGSGPDVIGLLKGVPILFVNFIPLSCLWSFYQMTCVPKRLRYLDGDRHLSLNEYLDSSFRDIQLYTRAGLEIIDLNEQEILLAVQEFWKRITVTWVESAEDLELQTQFWKEFQAWPDYSKDHDWKHPEARVGQAWLASMDDNFLKSN